MQIERASKRLAKMLQEIDAPVYNVVTGTGDATNIVRGIIGWKEEENFLVIYCNASHAIIQHHIESVGTIDGAAVYPRNIAKRALELNACAVILAHNHPSGTLKPSLADKNITLDIEEALSLFEIKVLDHIIVTKKESYSFAQNGLV